MTWLGVLAASAGAYTLKLAGLLVPERVLANDRLRRIAALLPVALLAALVAVQTGTDGRDLGIDARTAGLATAFILLVVRAPFLVVVFGACLVTAGLRL